ncbi:uncharacterized protein LOC131425510 [Malaya genurostris]|uniref:uncharacterized protein LOC131425510 n=1 Tax=Malaya genurostris TaxID=325434 RepID=UPI0026F3C82E|nr:uncharacterized protein LOC131425510 [Malaya genurostris]
MFRSIFACLGHIIQLIRNNLKPIILLTSFGTCIWLIVDTTNRPEFTRHGTTDPSDIRNRWNEKSVQTFLDMLDIEQNVTDLALQSEQCPLKDEIVFTAFVGDTLEEALWQYYTLIAFEQTSVLRIRPLLPRTTKQKLELLFQTVPMDIMDDLPFSCYDMGNAVILTSAMDIPEPERSDEIYIIDRGARRYMDVVSTHWRKMMQALYPADVELATNHLHELRNRRTASNTSEVEFVGIYIRREDRLPFDYYYRAITFQRKLHAAMLIFVVACEDPEGNLCSKINAPAEEVYVHSSRETSDSGRDFAMMSLCNHTIVSNEVGIFHALNSDGDVVVYEFSEPSENVRYIPWLVANELNRWYMLS